MVTWRRINKQFHYALRQSISVCLIGYQGRIEVCGIRDQRGGIGDQKGGIKDHSPGIRNHRPWDRDQQFLIGIRDQAVPHLWDQGRKLVTLLESRNRNLRTKMGSEMKKHTSLPPCVMQI